MPKPKKRVPWIVSGPEPVLEDLTAEQRQRITLAAGITFSKTDWKNIDRARRDFAWCTWAKGQAVEYKPFARRLETIAASAHNLLAALTDGSGSAVDKTSLVLWRELELSDGMTLLMMLDRLEKAARRARHRTKSQANAWQHDWASFVSMLASIFDDHGVRPTVTKWDVEKSSPFSRFVSAIMGTLPKEFRVYTQSPEGWAKALVEAVAARKKS